MAPVRRDWEPRHCLEGKGWLLGSWFQRTTASASAHDPAPVLERIVKAMVSLQGRRMLLGSMRQMQTKSLGLRCRRSALSPRRRELMVSSESGRRLDFAPWLLSISQGLLLGRSS